MHLTLIKTQDTDSKVPKGTHEDPRIFTFETLSVNSMFSAASLAAENYLLNFPLDAKHPEVISRRTREHLGQYLAKHTDYLILDFDGVKSAEDRDQVLRNFAGFKCVFFASRSCNDITNFNFKGILPVEKFTYHEVKRAITFINTMLSRNGCHNLADTSSARSMQLTAPPGKLRIFKCEEIGSALTRKDIRDYAVSKTIKSYKPTIRKEVFNLFSELGYFPTSPIQEDKVTFTHSATNGEGYAWYYNSPFTLWHWNPTKNVDIGSTFRKRFRIQDYIENQALGDLVKAGTTNNVFPYYFTEKDLYPQHLAKSLGEWRDDGGVFCLKSAMGTGKTRVIERILSMFKKVLIVTPRVSLAVELSQRLGIGLYTDPEYGKHRHLVCQFDSLFKINCREFQCVVMDEFMTLESHIINSNSGMFTANNVTKLCHLMQNEEIRTCLIDALLTENVQDYFRGRDLHWCVNEYKDVTPVLIHKTFESFLKELSSTNLRRITVSCVSRDKMYALKDFLLGVGHNPCTICSDNTPQERAEILRKFANFEYSALVYTPSISVGINIDSPVDRHFHFDPGRIVTPVQSIQMMKRARSPGQIDCFIGKGRQPGCLSVEEIGQKIRQDSQAGPYVKFNKWGESELSDAGWMFSVLKLHDNIWRFDGAEAFALLAGFNFNVRMGVQVIGAEEFKGMNLKSYRVKGELWTPQIREQILSVCGDHILKFEEYLQPNQVDDFLIYFDMRKCYDNPSWRTEVLNRAALRTDFNFRRDLDLFCDKMDLLGKEGSLSQKQFKDLTVHQIGIFGLIKQKRLLGDKLIERPEFRGLYNNLREVIGDPGDR